MKLSKLNKLQLGTILVLVFMLAGLGSLAIPKAETVEEKQAEVIAKEEPKSFTFMGVGDNLLHDAIFYYHEQDTGNRDFNLFYDNTRQYSQAVDLAYINFETVCAGDEFGLSGYPSFNGPTEFIDALNNAGYDWFSISSNHSMDAGSDGLIAEINYIRDHYPDIRTTGSFRSEEEADDPTVIDVNGVKVGLCGFTYGLNGYVKPEGMDWLIDVYRKDDGSVDYDLMKKKLDALAPISDVQFVAMHWGDEYVTQVTPEQREIADWLNEQGVEVIIGTHPHVIEPVEFIKGEKQETLCYFSLGNFLSAQDDHERMVGGMADFRLTYDPNTKETSFSDVKFIPTVTWISSDLHNYSTNTIHEYTDEMAASHYVSTQLGQDITKAWVNEYVHSVLGDPEGIEVVAE